MGPDDGEATVSDDQQQLRARLRNAERRLARAERAQINVASSTYGGHAGGPGDALEDTRSLNRQIADATGVQQLREEVRRLRAEVGGDSGQPGLLTRLRRRLRLR
jgi:hypothetical protein